VDIFHYAVVAHAKTRPLRPYALRRLFDSMLASGLQPDALGATDESASPVGAEQPGEGEGAAEAEPQRARSGGEVWGMLLHWLLKAQKDKPIVLDQALQELDAGGIAPDIAMCNAALACHAHARPARPADAEAILAAYMTEEAGGAGCRPSADSYELLARAYTRAGPRTAPTATHGNGPAPATMDSTDPASVGEQMLGRMAQAGVAIETVNLNAAIAGYALARPPRIEDVERILRAAVRL